MHLFLLQVVWARWWSHQGEQQVKKWKYFFILSQNKELLYNLIYEGLKLVFCEITFLTLDFSKEKKSRVDILKIFRPNKWESFATPSFQSMLSVHLALLLFLVFMPEQLNFLNAIETLGWRLKIVWQEDGKCRIVKCSVFKNTIKCFEVLI